MSALYLDSNVLISYYSIDSAEETKRALVQNALTVVAQFEDVELCTSNVGHHRNG